MPEETTPAGQAPATTETPTGQAPATSTGLDPAAMEKELTRARKEAAGYREKLKAREDAEKKALDDAAVANGKAAELLKEKEAELEKYRARETARQDAAKADLEALVKTLPDHAKSVVAMIEDPEKALDAARKLAGNPPPGGPSSKPPGNRGAAPPKPVNQMSPTELADYKASLRRGAS